MTQTVYRVVRVIATGTVWTSEVIHTTRDDAREEAEHLREEVGEDFSSVRVQRGTIQWGDTKRV